MSNVYFYLLMILPGAIGFAYLLYYENLKM